jgi:hypothetical protein
MTRSPVSRLARLIGLPVIVAACAPALNWRDVPLPEAAVALQFPCKPDAVSRQVPLVGRKVTMGLSSCQADGITFALSHAAMASPEEVRLALAAMGAAANTNLGGQAQLQAMLPVPGMTAHPGAQRLRVRAQRPGGQGALEQQVLLFTRGLRVYQATVIADRVSDEAANTFFGSLRLMP